MIGRTNIGVEDLSTLLTTQTNLITNIKDVLDTKYAGDNGKYVWGKWSISGTTKLEFIEYVVSDNGTEYPTDGIQNGYYYKLIHSPIDFSTVSWADGTDNEIVAMVAAADEGKINLSKYWAVGDERTVHLSAMPATYVGESHVEQDVKLVILSQGGKTLSDGKECNFIVGLKNCLKEYGYMNDTSSNSCSWNNCARRRWCNGIFKNSIPTTLLPIFKQHINKTATEYNGSSMTDSTDWFALAAGKEVFGTDYSSGTSYGGGYSNYYEAQVLSQFEYYKTVANRIKTLGEGVTNNYYWWERSPNDSGSSVFCSVSNHGTASYNDASYAYGLAPFGCI